ncbi:hypothetical protein ABZX12_14310 [Kribbella sp. NPDC003505]|uniref:hypothetical protein n=1 Tax=Kribbella sp. NPDC003505 TaxID=3154448 RepID=UPI0033B971EB
MERFDVRADAQLDDDNVMLTLSGDSWLLNVNASPVEWAAGLPRVPGADHAQRSHVSLGTCGRHPVWWSVSDGQLTISVGQDLESCDFVVILPDSLLSEIQAQLDDLDGNDWT